MKMKKVLSLILAGCMAISVLTACGDTVTTESSESKTTNVASETEKTTESTTESVAEGFQHDPILNELGAETICKEKVTLTVAIKANTNVEDYETNHLTKLIEEKANVDLQFVTYVGGEAQEKLRVQIAGNEKLPDIIMWGMEPAEIMELGEEGFFVPLEDYYANSSYYAIEGYKKWEDKGLDVLDFATTADGHIWQFQRMVDSLNNPTGCKMWVYRPWLEAVGMTVEDIKDADGFYEMLIRFKNNDPNGNGIADEIPLIDYSLDIGNQHSWVYLMNAFTATTPSKQFLRSENGELSVAYTQEEFKEGVKYISKLVQEGLFDSVSFTQDQNAMNSILNASGLQIAGAFTRSSPSNLAAEARADWILIDPLANASGSTVTAYAADLPGRTASITTSCEHPEVAFRVLDLMCDEYLSIVSRYGEEGVNWAYADDVKAQYPDADWSVKYGEYEPLIVELDTAWGKLQNAHWCDVNPCVRDGVIAGGVYAANIATGVAAPHIVQISEHYVNYNNAAPAEPITDIKYASADEQVEAQEIYTELSEYVLEKLAEWFTGISDVEKDWNNYLDELEAIGLSDWLETVQAGWN